MKPTYLYIKEHEITGLRYFGKTTKKNPESYRGSGSYWKKHIEKHGKDKVKTLWVSEVFTDEELLTEFATFFSQELNIVESKEWANLREENGFDGAPPGVIHPDHVTERFKINNPSGHGEKNPFYGKKHSEKQKKLWSESRLGEKNPNYGGKAFTEETLRKLRVPKSNKENYKGSSGKICCIDRLGNATQIDNEIYNNQRKVTSDVSKWEYVNTNSNEAKRRKQKD